MYYIVLRVFSNHNLFSNCFYLNKENTQEIISKFGSIEDIRNKVE